MISRLPRSLAAMPCPLANCWLCHLTHFGAEIADRCPDCLDDWICDGCAFEYDLTDVEELAMDLADELGDSDVDVGTATTAPSSEDVLLQDESTEEHS